MKFSRAAVLSPMLCRRIRPSSERRRHSCVLGKAVRSPTMETGMAASWMKAIIVSKISGGS
ncbi:MAG: hypothetical protein WBX50_08240 [Candidatus Deferrimicrobiaceae bacterium]